MTDSEVKKWYDLQMSYTWSSSIPWDKLPDKSKEFWRKQYANRPIERRPNSGHRDHHF